MGLIAGGGAAEFSMGRLEESLGRFAAVGIGRSAVSLRDTTDNLQAALEALDRDIEASPLPDTEWAAISMTLGADLTAELCGVSKSSARRYLEGERPTPDAVAARLHFLALVIADLLGAYNGYGVRRWFQRGRTALGGHTPADVLRGQWDPDDGAPKQVQSLAGQLVTMAIT
jgi:hypothetical protein